MGPYVESMLWGRDVIAYTAPTTPKSDRNPGAKGGMTPEDLGVLGKTGGVYAHSTGVLHANGFVGKG